jgi:hypothetical protein
MQSNQIGGDRNGIAFYARPLEEQVDAINMKTKFEEELKPIKFKSPKGMYEIPAPKSNMQPERQGSNKFLQPRYERGLNDSKTGATTMGSTFPHSSNERRGRDMEIRSMDANDSSLIDSI